MTIETCCEGGGSENKINNFDDEDIEQRKKAAGIKRDEK